MKHKPYTGTTRSNGKYIRLTEMLDIINERLPTNKKVSRETLLARIRTYVDQNQEELENKNIELLKQDPSNSPGKSPMLVNYDYIKSNIPSLIESEMVRDLATDIKNLAEQMRVLMELMYLKGWLRRP